MPISDNILPLFVIYSVVHVLLWVFNRIKEGFGSDHCILMVLHLLMFLCLFLKLMPVYERLVNKSTLVLPAMYRYHQSTVFTEYSIYWGAVDHPRVLTEVSWLKPSSALMKFVSYRGIATKSQSIIIRIKTITGGHCENKYDLPSISRCKTVVNWDRSEVVVSAGLSSQTALSLSASDGSWRGTLLTHVSRDWQDLAAAFLFLFSCSLLPITYYTKN